MQNPLRLNQSKLINLSTNIIRVGSLSMSWGMRKPNDNLNKKSKVIRMKWVSQILTSFYSRKLLKWILMAQWRLYNKKLEESKGTQHLSPFLVAHLSILGRKQLSGMWMLSFAHTVLRSSMKLFSLMISRIKK